MRKAGSLLSREAKATVIGSIAYEDDCAMAKPARCSKRMADERSPDPATATIGVDGHWTEKQSRLAGAAHNIPESGSTDNAFAVRCHEGEALGRHPAVPQALRTLAPAQLAESLVEQRFACCDIGSDVLS